MIAPKLSILRNLRQEISFDLCQFSKDRQRDLCRRHRPNIPIIALSGGYKGLELLGQASVPWFETMIGTVLSALTAYLCIHSFMRFVERVGMLPFVIYRLLLGAVLIYLLLE